MKKLMVAQIIQELGFIKSIQNGLRKDFICSKPIRAEAGLAGKEDEIRLLKEK